MLGVGVGPVEQVTQQRAALDSDEDFAEPNMPMLEPFKSTKGYERPSLAIGVAAAVG